MSRGPIFAVVVCVGALAVASAPICADAKGRGKGASKAEKKAKKRAKRLDKKGKKLYAKGRYDDAIAAFELAYEADPKPRFLFNIGRAYERKGDLFKAMEHLQGYVDLVEDEGEREDAEDLHSILRTKLEKTCGELTLTTDPPGATVLLKGSGREVRGTGPLRRWLEAGSWELEVSHADFPPHRQDLSIPLGRSIEHEVVLRERPDPPPVAAPPPPDDPAPDKAQAAVDPPNPEAMTVQEPRSADGPGWGAWGSLAAGGALLAAGAVLGVMASGASDDLDAMKSDDHDFSEVQAQHAQVEDRALMANVLLGAGAVGLLTGGALLVW